MISDLRLHGSLGNIDFFTFIAGADTSKTYFYEEGPSSIRFFSRGNEFVITDDGISYHGIGGSFCEYMFGVEKPVKDLEKEDIRNRLIMFGAFLDRQERVVFTNETSGSEPFSRLFLQGHAVVNYHFMVASDFKGDPRRRQQQVLKSVGKFLKRTDLVAEDRDTELLNRFMDELGEARAIVFLFKLIHRWNKQYYDAFRYFYGQERVLTPQAETFLEEVVTRNQIDRYQQERMKIDVMYRHPQNRVVVDEYRDILLNAMHDEEIRQSDQARLNRLRTLSIRNTIPVSLFDTLDELLLKGKKLKEHEEHDYLREARAILENLFFKDPTLKKHIINEDIVRLIWAKHLSYTQNDRGFEQVLLDIGKACDDLARETEDFSVFEEFSSIVTYFDRYDNVQTLLNQLSFMKNIDFREESLRSLIGNRKEFDALDRNLFRKIFIEDLMANKYITAYGRRKVMIVNAGVERVQSGDASLKDVMAELRKVTEEERLYNELNRALKERMRGFFPGLDTPQVRKHLREDIAAEFCEKGVCAKIPDKLFDKVLFDLRKESVYLNQILPVVIEKGDYSLRDDFLENSGLDRFYVESLEQEYFHEKELDTGLLELLREGKPFLSESGGGERIRTAE